MVRILHSDIMLPDSVLSSIEKTSDTRAYEFASQVISFFSPEIVVSNTRAREINTDRAVCHLWVVEVV